VSGFEAILISVWFVEMAVDAAYCGYRSIATILLDPCYMLVDAI
jgi:hypothetical protein